MPCNLLSSRSHKSAIIIEICYYITMPTLAPVKYLGNEKPTSWKTVLETLRRSNFSVAQYQALPDANPTALDLICMSTLIKGIPLVLDRLEVPLAHQEKILGAKPRLEDN